MHHPWQLLRRESVALAQLFDQAAGLDFGKNFVWWPSFALRELWMPLL